MTRVFKEYTDVFFWNFKRGDNVNYNFEIIEKLYEAKRRFEGDTKFNKPIIILFMAIVECAFFDYFYRVKEHVYELIPNLAMETIGYIRSLGKADLFGTLIIRVRSQNILKVLKDDSLYDDLDLLGKVRNRVHIQNKHGELEKDEANVFTDARLKMAERAFVRTITILETNYPRKDMQPLPMNEFPCPWEN